MSTTAKTEPAASFLKSLFQGDIEEDLIFPFPDVPAETKETVAAFAEAYGEFAKEHIDAEKLDREHHFPRELIKAMGDLGLLGMSIPEEYGGAGFTPAAYCRMMEAIVSHDSSAAIVVGAHQSIGLKPVLLYGTDEQKQKWLPELATGERVAAFCLTEPEAGSDAGSVKTTAVYDPKTDEYVLNGTKQWISNGGFASFFTVFARVPSELADDMKHKEVACFAVVTDRDGTLPGLERGPEEQKLGLCASSTCQIILEDCRVPAFNLIGTKGKGFKIALETLNTGRTSIGAGAAGGAKYMLKLAVEHATQRRQFGQRIADFEMTRRKITTMAANTYATESMVYLTCALAARGFDYSLEGACCKIFGGEMLWQSINDALQIAGGNGFMNEYPYGRVLRDARVNMIFEGTNEILRVLIALSGFKDVGDQLKEVQRALRKPLEKAGVLAGYAQKRMNVARDHLTKVHPLLSAEADHASRYERAFANAVDSLVRREGKRVIEKQYQQERLADVAIELFAQMAMLSRVTASIGAKGAEKAMGEVALVRWFCSESRHRIVGKLKALDSNRDRDTTAISDTVYEAGGYPYDLWS
jgi:acyl-CoA dehydrogenase family member 9